MSSDLTLDDGVNLGDSWGYAGRGLHGWIVETIGRRIVGGALAPGVVLPHEGDLMSELGASRTSVREALRVLASKGLIESRQKVGTRVRPRRSWNLLDPDLLAWHASEEAGDLMPQLFELRRLVEPLAVRLAAERQDGQGLAALDQALDRMRACAEEEGEDRGDGDGDGGRLYRADVAFHQAIFAATGNPFVERLGATVSALLDLSFRLNERMTGIVSENVDLHAAIVEGIHARDPARAEAAAIRLIDAARGVFIPPDGAADGSATGPDVP